MLAAGALAARPFDLSGILGGTAVAAEPEWDAGDLLPRAAHREPRARPV